MGNRGEKNAERSERQSPIYVGLLTGGIDRPYVYGLAMVLVSKDVRLDIIGSDAVSRPELHAPKLNFLNLRGNLKPNVSFKQKLFRILLYYVRLVRYAWAAEPKVFHIL